MNGKTNKLIVILLVILIIAVLGVGAIMYFDINSNETPTDSNPVGETDKDDSNDNADKDNNEQNNENENDNNEVSKPISKPNFDLSILDSGDSLSEALENFNRKNYSTVDNFDLTINNSKHNVTVVYGYYYGNYPGPGCDLDGIINTKIFIDNKNVGNVFVHSTNECFIADDLDKNITERHKNIIKQFIDLDINNIKINNEYFKIVKGTDNKEYIAFITGTIGVDTASNYITIINEDGKILTNEIINQNNNTSFGIPNTDESLRENAKIYDNYIEYSYYDWDKETFNIAKLTLNNDKINYEIIKSYDNVIVAGGTR